MQVEVTFLSVWVFKPTPVFDGTDESTVELWHARLREGACSREKNCRHSLFLQKCFLSVFAQAEVIEFLS